MVTVNAVSVTVYTKKKSIACLEVFTPSAMRRFKKPCNCYGPRENDCMALTLLIGLWRDRPFLPQNTPPPQTPQSYYWTLSEYAADQNSDRSVTGSTEPIAWQPKKTAQPTFGEG